MVNLPDCSQLCLVLSKDWKTHIATQFLFEKKEGEWNLIKSHPVVIGKNGMAWGEERDGPSLTGEEKKEGDGKTPAGVFSFSTVFGKALNPRISMPYLHVTEELECVDDPQSQYYNQMVYPSKIPQKDWSSSEKMTHELYTYGIVVDYNIAPAAPGKGSCIFFHTWRNIEKGTLGCTAMPEEELKDLIFWLDPIKKPLLIQLPYEEYLHIKPLWNLPKVRILP